MEFDARRRTSASPLSSKLHGMLVAIIVNPRYGGRYGRSICVWTWNRAREIRLTRTRPGFFSVDSIIIHRLHRRRVLIIRLERARRMDREPALWEKKHAARERESREAGEEIGHAESSLDAPLTRAFRVTPVYSPCKPPACLYDYPTLTLFRFNGVKFLSKCSTSRRNFSKHALHEYWNEPSPCSSLFD